MIYFDFYINGCKLVNQTSSRYFLNNLKLYNMNHEQYLQKVKELESEFENKKVELMKEFVRANNPYKIGDKVTDHIGTIII